LKWFDWYHANYYKTGNFRYPSFLLGLSILYQKTSSNRIIVETGSQRQLNDIGSGESTRIFNQFCLDLGGFFCTIDNNHSANKVAKEIIDSNANCILNDSVEFLKQFTSKIDLLYMDSLDFSYENPEASAQHCLNEMEMAYNNNPLIVIIDDNIRKGNQLIGKGMLARQFLLSHGYLEIFSHQQSVFLQL
ncbi:MAG: class I SAM-dependent methyltransferase, partial [Candidatus Heimdallarchaeota archaeon]